MPLIIRPATPADVPTLLQFVRDLAEFERLADHVTATEERFHEALFGPEAIAGALLAEENETPLGFALYFYNFSTFLARPGIYLEDLYVRPDARGRGIGRTLLVELARLAVSRGCGRLEWAVLDWNEHARRFYEDLGAQPMSDWILYRLTGEPLRALGRSGDRATRRAAPARRSRVPRARPAAGTPPRPRRTARRRTR